MPPNKRTMVWLAGAGVLCAGLFYGYVLIPLGFRIPCLFREVTGLRCPGCGVTDMCLAILHGRFAQVPHYNWGLALTLPLLVGVLAVHVLCPLTPRRQRLETAVGVLAAAMLLIWGVCRNLAGI